MANPEHLAILKLEFERRSQRCGPGFGEPLRSKPAGSEPQPD